MFEQKRSPVPAAAPLCLVCKPLLVKQNVGVQSAEEDELSLSISKSGFAYIPKIHQPTSL